MRVHLQYVTLVQTFVSLTNPVGVEMRETTGVASCVRTHVVLIVSFVGALARLMPQHMDTDYAHIPIR